MAASTKVSDMCRLCGTDTLNVVRHHIFEGEGQVKKSAQKISECLPLHIAAEDPLPKNICGECSYKLDLMSDFREKAVKTDVMLVSLVEGVKPEIPDDDDDGPDHEIDNDFRSDTPVEQPEQQTEPEVLIKEEEAQQPQQPEKRPGRKAANKRPIQESDMEEEEEEAPAKKRGRKPKEKETAPAASATTSASTNPPKENTGCNEQGGGKDLDKERLRSNLRTVLLTDEKKRLKVFYECAHCLFRLPSFASVCTHMLEEHNERPFNLKEDKQEHPCTVCGRKFSSETKLEEHMRDHTGVRPFLCPTCGKSFKTKDILKCHMKTHEERVNAFTCEVCGKLFPMISRLKAHRNIHFPESRTKKCDICGFSTYCKSKLKNHMRTHTREKTFSCDECGKSFLHNSGLFNHKQKHKRFSHKCFICGRAFSIAFNLRRHMATHTGKKDFECDICHNFFAQKSTLIQHQWLKHNNLPYKCGKCDEQFQLNLELKQHRITVHLKKQVDDIPDKEPVPCQECNRSLFHERSLKFHMLKAHNKEVKGVRKTQKKSQKLICDFCNKVYAVPYHLRKHIEKHLQVEVEKKNLTKP
ncbi:zinc finger protein 62 homolog isoform X14 [Cloeon dipterum]|uniref:zinc finger protein 62 homolog isoform X14 n=1 Tax=Cloeon dipterum TaxID=197152 RepID=UPI00322094EF